MAGHRVGDLGGVGVRVLLIGTGTHDDPGGPGGSVVGARPLPPVPAAVPTVLRLRRTLVDRCDVAPERVRVLADPATVHELAAAVVEEANAADTVLVVHYVGHGLVGPSGGLHLAVRSTPMTLAPGMAELQAYPLAQLWQAIGRTRASSIVVVLDCCFSGREAMPAVRDASVFTRPSVDGVYLLAAARDHAAADSAGRTDGGPPGG